MIIYRSTQFIHSPSVTLTDSSPEFMQKTAVYGIKACTQGILEPDYLSIFTSH